MDLNVEEKRPFFSIIIATYNSEKTLGYTLQSIRSQTIDQNELEILVIDGGSTDATKTIAKEYHTTVLENPKKLPEYAKAVGVHYAKGYYVMRMDSDEEFTYPDQLQEKMDFCKKNPEIKMVISNRYSSGRKNICGISAEYMNILGDPFSYFIYQTKLDKYRTYKKNIVSEDGKFVIMKFEDQDIYPLADSATSILSLDYLREQYPDEYDSIEFTCSAYDRVLRDTKYCGLIKEDNISHNCSSSLKTYFSKLRFRVINNLFHKDESGFSSKEHLSRDMKKRKILFCLYVLLIPIPILDSIRLAIIYKNPTYLLHVIYTYYVCFMIFGYGLMKVFGKTTRNESYGKKDK